jgi:hypothetical protein
LEGLKDHPHRHGSVSILGPAEVYRDRDLNRFAKDFEGELAKRGFADYTEKLKSEIDLRSSMVQWCEEKGYEKLGRRLARAPGRLLYECFAEPPEEVDGLLTVFGY